MLGFQSISEEPISSYTKVTFFIRGNSSVFVSIDLETIGAVLIKGNSDSTISVSTTSIGHIKLTRTTKNFKAYRYINDLYSKSNDHDRIVVDKGHEYFYSKSTLKKIIVKKD